MKPLRRNLTRLVLVGTVVVILPTLSSMFQNDELCSNCTDWTVGPLHSPTAAHWLGTDDRGRDVLVRLIHGVRNTVLFASAVGFASSLLGWFVGTVQGFVPTRIDRSIEYVSDTLLSMPWLYLAMFLGASGTNSALTLACFWVAFAWIRTARVCRLTATDYVKSDIHLALLAQGLHRRQILLRHLLTATSSGALVLLPYTIASCALGLASLDFLGMGLAPPSASLGELLRQASHNIGAWWIGLPSIAVLSGLLYLLVLTSELCAKHTDPTRQLR